MDLVVSGFGMSWVMLAQGWAYRCGYSLYSSRRRSTGSRRQETCLVGEGLRSAKSHGFRGRPRTQSFTAPVDIRKDVVPQRSELRAIGIMGLAAEYISILRLEVVDVIRLQVLVAGGCGSNM